MLEDDIKEEADSMAFTPKMRTHNKTDLSFDIAFENSDKMALGESANLIIEIKEPSVLKSLETLKALDHNYFEGLLPPLLPDPEEAKYFNSMSETIVGIVENCIRSNFFLLIIFGSAMASFWGMIRAVQMMTLSSLIRVTIPAMMMVYIIVCI